MVDCDDGPLRTSVNRVVRTRSPISKRLAVANPGANRRTAPNTTDKLAARTPVQREEAVVKEENGKFMMTRPGFSEDRFV
jgi:hypothetical protein